MRFGETGIKRALADVERALNAGHPAPIKLLERKIDCLLKLGLFSKTKQVIEEALENQSLSGDERISLLKKSKAISDANQQDESESEIKADNEKSIIFSPNTAYPSLSSAISIKYEKDRGRFGIASRDINVGETLVYESPTGAKVKKDLEKDHCGNCLRMCEGYQIPCTRCIESRFCSEECLLEAESSYHPYECQHTTKNTTKYFEDVLNNIRGDSIGFHKLLYRLVAQRPVTFFQDHIAWSKNHDEKFAPKNGIINKNGSKPFKLPKISKDEDLSGNYFLGGSYRGLWSLVGHSDNDDPVGIFWIIISAVFHLRTLQVTGYFGSENKAISSTLSPDQLVIGSVLVNILQMLRYNAHSILSQVDDKNGNWKSWKTGGIGNGLYPSLALLNHSCAKNVTKYYDGSTVVAVASRHIFKGEEVTDNYHPWFAQMPRKARREYLHQFYCFDCNCSACKNDYSTLAELKQSNILPWRCIDCNEYFYNEYCLNCNMKLNVEEMILKLGEIKTSLKENTKKFESKDENLTGVYNDLCNNSDDLTKLLGPNCEIVVENGDFLRTVLCKLYGNKSNII